MKNATKLNIKLSLAEVTLSTLVVVGAVGAVAVIALFPNLLKGIKFAGDVVRGYNRAKRRVTVESVKRSVYYLKRHGYIHFRSDGLGHYIIALTRLGKKKLSQIEFEKLAVPKPKHWDKKWWGIAGDIPTKTHRHGADLLRAKLKQMGFCALQKSLWFYPYNPRTQLEIILETFHLKRYVTLMEIDKLDADDERVLRKHFKRRRIL
jgi:hypothetical protein